jgi:hypothetical protein
LLDDIKALPPAVKFGVPVVVIGGYYLYRRYKSAAPAASTPTGSTGSDPGAAASVGPANSNLSDDLAALAKAENADLSRLNKRTAVDQGKVNQTTAADIKKLQASGQRTVARDHTGVRAPVKRRATIRPVKPQVQQSVYATKAPAVRRLNLAAPKLPVPAGNASTTTTSGVR